jgi:hypothetical protein
MNIIFLLNLFSRKTRQREQEAIVLVPFLRNVSRGVVAIQPERQGHNSSPLGCCTPSVSQYGIGMGPTAKNLLSVCLPVHVYQEINDCRKTAKCECASYLK